MMNMKTIAMVAAATTIGAGAAAHAGGFVPPVMETAPVAVEVDAPVAGAWQGGYAGLTLGYAFKGEDRVGLSDGTDTLLGDIGEAELKGANAGLRAGYRWQRGNWVFGPEVGIEGGSIKGDTDGSVTIDGVPTDFAAESKVNNMIALRFKTGYAVRPDMLVYGIAGVGRVDMDYELNGVTDSFSKTGYILGLGVEKQITEKWSVTGEYEYANFGKEDLQFGTLDTEATPKYSNIKVGVNFRF